MRILILFTLIFLLMACSEKAAEQKQLDKGLVEKESALEHAVKHLDPKYVCPMHPQIIRDEPGQCPICGMDLVEKIQKQKTNLKKGKIIYYRHPHKATITSNVPKKDEMGMDYLPVYDSEQQADIKISAVVENNLGIRTALVQRDKLWRKINTVGFVELDEDKMIHIHMRAKGWIQNLKVKAKGERVKKGDLLFEFYSPTLVNAQEEYIQALRSHSKSLIRASRDKLQALAVSAQQIKQIAKTRQVSQLVGVYASQDGVVSETHAREGMYIAQAMKVMTLADLSTVWVQAEVFESQSAWVKQGQPAQVSLRYLPGPPLEGKVDYIYPSLNPKTRTLKVRLRFPNPSEKLKPNMYASVTIFAGAKKNILLIQRSALIRTGESQRVILAIGNGRYRARPVVAGIESGDWVEIQSGLEQGDRVVTSGQFLIDSEASMNASLARMQHDDNNEHQAMLTKQSSDKTDFVEPISANATVLQVDIAGRRLKLDHEAIVRLKLPAMEMWFDVNSNFDLKQLKKGMKIRIELQRLNDAYTISSIKLL